MKKIILEIPDESVCMSVTIGLQGTKGWGMATFSIDEPDKIHDRALIELQADYSNIGYKESNDDTDKD